MHRCRDLNLLIPSTIWEKVSTQVRLAIVRLLWVIDYSAPGFSTLRLQYYRQFCVWPQGIPRVTEHLQYWERRDQHMPWWPHVRPLPYEP
jgi:hypothetical protein